MGTRSSRHRSTHSPARARPAKFARPRCEPFEDRIAPALFDVQSPMFFTGLNNNGCVVAVDLNKDGRMDAVLTNEGLSVDSGDGNTITVLYGKAGGGFTRVSLPTGGTNVSFASVGDINGDGWPDVVATNENTQGIGTVTVFQNVKGNLSKFGNPFPTAGNNSSCVRLADVTGDNILDVIVSSFGKDDGTGQNIIPGNVTIFQGGADGQGHGNFTFTGPITTLAPEISFVPIAVAVADFDGDGAQDIAAVSPGVPPDFDQAYPDGTVYLFKGNGVGGFEAPVQYDSGGVLPVNVQAADLDGDGLSDLVVANAGDPNATAPEFKDNSVGVLLNISTPGNLNFGFANSLNANCHGTFAVAVADYDLDGHADIAAVNYGSQLATPNAFVSIYVGDGNGTFTAGSPGMYDTNTGFGGGQYLAAGDFDGNGTPDLIVAHATNLVGLLLNTTTVAPTVTINQAATQADPTKGTSIAFDVKFSEGVTGFDASDVDLSASTISGLSAAVTEVTSSQYTVTVTGMTGVGTVKASIPAGAAAGTTSGTATLASTSTDNQVTFDAVAPTVTINQAAGQADPTTTGPVRFTVAFSENVKGFAADDIDLSGSSLGGLTATVTKNSPSNYTVSVSGMSGNGTVVAKVLPGAATDDAGNPSDASTSTDNLVIFGVGPSVTINQAAGQADPTNSGPVAFTVHFSEPVTGFDGSDVQFTGSTVGGTLQAAVSGPSPGQDYTVTVTGMTGAGKVVASIPAGAAINGTSVPSSASTWTDNEVTFDAVAPTVTINQAGGQADPTSTPSVTFDVKFSEPVTGFSATDVSLAGSTAGGNLSVAVTGSLDTYQVTVTGMTSTGSVVANIPAGGAADDAGNANLDSGSTDNSVRFESRGTVGFSQAEFRTTEESGTVTVTVTRAGQTTGAVSIEYATSPDTAHTGGSKTTGQADFEMANGKLSWADGEGGDKTFTVPIGQDNLNEGWERFNLTLTNPVGGPGLGRTSAQVAIRPSDGQVINAQAKLPQVPAAVFFDDAGLAGDRVTVRLAGLAGTATVYLTDWNGDRNGPPEEIELANTDPLKSRLIITAVKPRGGTGDGRTTLAEVSGSGLKVLNAAAADLNGPGIHLDGFLSTLRIGNISGAAVISMGSPPPNLLLPAVRITAGQIGDGTDITTTARLANLTAISIGDGTITAPSAGAIVARGKAKTLKAAAIPGNFKSDVTISGAGVDPLKPALARLRAAGSLTAEAITVGGNLGVISVGGLGVGDLTGTAITVSGNLGALRVGGRVSQATIDVTGNVTAVAVGSFWNSRLDAGPVIGTFRVAAPSAGFQSSNVIATTINSVVLASVNPDNLGTPFGFKARHALKALMVTSPAQRFVFNPQAASPQTLGDFQAEDLDGPF